MNNLTIKDSVSAKIAHTAQEGKIYYFKPFDVLEEAAERICRV